MRRIKLTGSVIGLDLSLQSAGLCAIHLPWAPGDWARVRTKCVQAPKSRIARLLEIEDAVMAFVKEQPEPRHVFIEGYSFGSAHRAHHLGELGGVVRRALFCEAFGYITLHEQDVPSATWRKLLLGKVPRADAKVLTHQALLAAGLDRSGDELDAFGVANWGITELGGVALSLAA